MNYSNQSDYLMMCQELIRKNCELIQRTAIKDCHALGLNSFILSESPKVRMFVAEPNSELHEPFLFHDPLIPIHSHKYDDNFVVLKGILNNHVYTREPNDNMSCFFNKYTYKRIGDKDSRIEKVGNDRLYLSYKESITSPSTSFLPAANLHTASVSGDEVIWLIIEGTENPRFEQFSYHQNLVDRPELYNNFEDAVYYVSFLIQSLSLSSFGKQYGFM